MNLIDFFRRYLTLINYVRREFVIDDFQAPVLSGPHAPDWISARFDGGVIVEWRRLMKVRQVMHKGVAACQPSTPVAQVAMMMKADDIGAVPVSENGKIVGMVTDRDIAVRAFADGRDPEKLIARDVMSASVSCCGEDEEIDKAVRLMEVRKIRRLPVTDAKSKLVGILSLGDISHAVSQSVSGELVKAVSAHH
jgi:CBS domain-containing protein